MPRPWSVHAVREAGPGLGRRAASAHPCRSGRGAPAAWSRGRACSGCDRRWCLPPRLKGWCEGRWQVPVREPCSWGASQAVHAARYTQHSAAQHSAAQQGCQLTLVKRAYLLDGLCVDGPPHSGVVAEGPHLSAGTGGQGRVRLARGWQAGWKGRRHGQRESSCREGEGRSRASQTTTGQGASHVRNTITA